jgi:large subunit ribosomal protein L9
MKVILLRDVAKIGRRFEVKEVPSGHAQNFLIPRKLAEPATDDALRRLAVELKKKSIMTDRHDGEFTASLASLKTTGITLSLAANEKGHLFKGVHESDIVKHLKEQGIEVRASEIVLPHPLKDVGEHHIVFKSGAITETITIRITRA